MIHKIIDPQIKNFINAIDIYYLFAHMQKSIVYPRRTKMAIGKGNDTVNDQQNSAQTGYDDTTTRSSNPLSAINALFNKYGSSSLSSAGSAFLAAVRANLTDASKNETIIFKQLDSPANTYIAYTENREFGIMIYFQECIDTANVQGILKYTQMLEMKESLSKIESIGRILSCIAATPEDYANPDKFANIIFNTLVSYTDTTVVGLNAKSLSAFEIVIDPSTAAVKQFISNNTLGLEPRVDFGVVIGIRQRMNGGYNDPKAPVRPIGVIGAYPEYPITEMLIPNTSNIQTMFCHMVHISAMYSFIGNETILPLLLSEAFDVLPIIAREPQNLGGVCSLFVDPESKKVWKPGSAEELRNHAERNLTKPVIVIDSVDGKHQIPGISRVIGEKTAYRAFSEFLDTDITKLIDSSRPLFKQLYTELVGTAEYGKTSIDSRYIDYAWLTEKLGYKQEQTIMLKRFSPAEQFEHLKKMYDNVTPYYVNSVAAIEPNAMGAIVGHMKNIMNITSNFAQAEVVYNYNNIANFAVANNANYFTGNGLIGGFRF
jgi:hypothetical protein